MTVSITLTDLVIRQIILDYDLARVHVVYDRVDSNGKKWDSGDAYFWAVMPEMARDINGNLLEIPANWFQLPAEYFPTLIGLRDDADNALTAKFLV